MWEQVQIELARREELGAKYSSHDIFASKLICEDFGGFYGKRNGIPTASTPDSFINATESLIKARKHVVHHISWKKISSSSSSKLIIIQ
jgi:hypothetical protein